MRIAVTGSIATDHLMVFAGRFAELLVPDHLHALSLSFLVDGLEIRRGGVAPNICFGLATLGLRPLLVGAAGEDFASYRSWLERNGVDCGGVRVSEKLHTAQFVCTTDADANQIASFYTGAMAEAREIELRPLVERHGPFDLVHIGADDPAAMVRHTEECHDRGYPFAADPSQQLARMEGPEIRTLIDGAAYLFSNEYERALIGRKTGWSEAEVLDRVGVLVTTLGADGVRIDGRDVEPFQVACPREIAVADPTGVGDAFRAGFLAGLSWRLGLERSAQLGCMIATLAIETVGTQEYQLEPVDLLVRFAEAYGDAAAEEIEIPLTEPAVPEVALLDGEFV